MWQKNYRTTTRKERAGQPPLFKMNYNATVENYNNSFEYIPEKLRRNYSGRGINAVKGYSAEALGCKSPERAAREMHDHIARKMPNVYPKIRNAATIAARKKDEEKVARLSADEFSKTSVIERIVGIEKKPGEYSKRDIIKKAEAAERDIRRAEEPEKYVRATRFPISVLATVIICSVMTMFIVYSGVMIKDIMNDISSLKTESAELAERERELSLELEVKNDLRVIEQIAVNELGMIKKDFITKNYITMGNEDKIEVYGTENEGGIDGTSSTLLSAIGEQIGRFVEYLD